MDQRLTPMYRFKSQGSSFLEELALLDVSGLFSENRVVSIETPASDKLVIDDDQI